MYARWLIQRLWQQCQCKTEGEEFIAHQHTRLDRINPRRNARRIVLIYAAFAAAWIGLSDLALEWVINDPAMIVKASMIKGWVFVLVTAILLYLLVSSLVGRIEDAAKAEEILREKKNHELEASEQRLRFALEASGIGASEIDSKTGQTFRTPLHDRLYGYSEPVAEWSLEMFLNHVLEPDRSRVKTVLQEAVETGGDLNQEFRIRRLDGKIRWLRAAGHYMPERSGTGQRLVIIVQDITEQKESRYRIENLAFYDQLTQLPNRTMLLQRLDECLQEGQQAGDYRAILVLDIDGFKFINDIQGHDVGDALLRSIADRLQQHLDDKHFIARVGSDQFAILTDKLGVDQAIATSRVGTLAKALHDKLDQPHDLPDAIASLRHSTSTGICLFHKQENTPQSLLNKAEIALEEAKNIGRSSFHFFSDELQAAVEARTRLENDLRQALAQDELGQVLQSQFDHQGRLIGAEILLRWEHPDKGMISPAQFIPLAESTGLIIPIGQMVMEKACACLRKWQQGAETRDLICAVNISARQFHQPDFIDRLADCLDRHGVTSSGLQLEVTESVVLEDLEMVLRKMNRIRELGIGLALDDFGTGYSSLSYLKSLPFDQLKIDRSFVRDMSTNVSSAAIVRAILAMGQGLDLRVVAEGVETEQQHQWLLDHGCDAFQGYLFARPVPIDEWTPGSAGPAFQEA